MVAGSDSMSQIINESTAVVQVDSSGLQNGQTQIIYVSSTTIPGQLVTVIDATGFLSSPQSILISTTGAASFQDGSRSTILHHGFSYLTLVSQNQNVWAPVNITAFPEPTQPATYKALDSAVVTTQYVQARGLVSSMATATAILNAQTTLTDRGAALISSLYVNALSSFATFSATDPRLFVVGSEHIYGSTVTIGAGSFRESISTLGDCFNRGNISSKAGTIYVGGDVTTSGTIRGQRGNLVRTAYMNIYTSASFVGPVSFTSSVSTGNFLTARSITCDSAFANAINIISSITFNAQQSVRNNNTIEFIGTSITVPSTISTSLLSASNAVETSNIFFSDFSPSPNLAALRLGSTIINNAQGSLTISSITGNRLTMNTILSKQTEQENLLSVTKILMNDLSSNSFYSIGLPGGQSYISSFWTISSTGTNGSMYAPSKSLSTNLFVGRDIVTRRLDTVTDFMRNFNTNTVKVTGSAMFSSVNAATMRNVQINNRGGSIIGSRTETTQNIFCSSMKTDRISTGGSVLRFSGSNLFSLPTAYISSLDAGSMTTSSINVPKIVTGSSALYSTVNLSSAWMLTSTFQMNGTDPFNTTTGLGTYFEQVSFIASKSQTAYYTIFDPSAQSQIYLSTPYVNTILGTGIRGINSTTTQSARYSRLGFTTANPATDSSGNIYVASTDAGWRVQRIDASGDLTTIAGQYRYFYGDGGFPLNAALSPSLAVSLKAPGELLITDISNERIRYVTTDPIIMTIAGTGNSAYAVDGGLAYLASFSTPTATATDTLNRIFVADTASQVIRRIAGSTISLIAGTPGVAGQTGDGGSALSAKLNRPYGLAVKSNNDLLFTDISNSVIRVITSGLNINLVAGNYTRGFSGDGGLATSATLSYPRGVTVDSQNNIYFCDTGNARIRRIDATTQIITTVAGNGVNAYGGDGGSALLASFSTPTGITTDAANNLYVADTDNQCIRYINLSTNIVTTVAGRPRQRGYGGDKSFATFALLNSPSHIVFDPTSAYYYFADDGNARIRYVNSATRIIFTAAGNGSPASAGDGGPAINAVFTNITSVATDTNNNIFIADAVANNIRRIDPTNSTIYTYAGTSVGGFSGDGGLALNATISSPQTIAFDTLNNMYFTDKNNQRVRRVNKATSTMETIAGTGVAGYNGDSISSTAAQLNFPSALAIDSQGELYVGDNSNYRIRKINTNGYITTFAGCGIQGTPQPGDTLVSTTLSPIDSLAIKNSTIYFTDTATSAVWQIINTLEPLSAISTPAYLGDAAPISTAYFNNPTGLAVDNSGDLLICDTGNFRLRRTYTFGYPLNPLYVNMSFGYTNYFVSSGTATISLNGNPLTTFYASTMLDSTFSITDTNILNYPLQGSNPVYGNQQPYIQITQQGANGYTKLDGTMFVNQVPGQGLLRNMVDSEAGIIMNSGILQFPHQNHGITIENSYNDASLRAVNYTGSLVNASDPALKENIVGATLPVCYTTLASLPLRRYNYVDPYMSTFHLADKNRLGFLTSEVRPFFPNSLQATPMEHAWAPRTINMLDIAQIKYTHYGVTQQLIATVSTLEAETTALSRVREKLRDKVAQRNSIH